MPARSRSKAATARNAAPSQTSDNNTNYKGASAGQVNLWKKLFREIDVDDSDAIDVDELFEAMSRTYPELKLTYSDIVAMIDEADTNHDGEIDEDEFIAIMGAAHGQNDLWGKVNISMYGNLKRNLASIGNAIHSTTDVFTAPIRQVSAEHSYVAIRKDGGRHLLVSPGMRILANTVTCFIWNGFLLFYVIYMGINLVNLGIKINVDMISSGKNFISQDGTQDQDVVTKSLLGAFGAGLMMYFSLGVLLFIGLLKGKTLGGMLFGFHFTSTRTGETYGFLRMVGVFLADAIISGGLGHAFGTLFSLVPYNFILILLTGRDVSQLIMDYDVVLDK